MPRIYRSMTREGDQPKVGPSARTLGVRPGIDVTPDPNGNVRPETGGMSVAPSWRVLPPWRIPKRLDSMVPGATGKDEDACWSFGEGPFECSPVNDQLSFRPDSADHGLVEPAAIMNLDDFQAALAATRDEWVIDET